MSVFDAEKTTKQLRTVYETGLKQTQPYWNFGYPILTNALCDLKRGLWFIVAPENVGKSMFQINLGYKVLTSNTDTYWLDISLDDSTEDRIGYLLACTGDLPISLVRRAGAAPDDQKEFRKQAFQKFNQQFCGRYGLKSVADESDDDEIETNFYDVINVCKMLVEARQQIGPDGKLFVTIDGFHDLMLPTVAAEETTQQKHKSQALKKAASKANALIVISAQTRKDSRKRNITADVMKGEDTPVFDAKVITHLYSDVNLNRDTADIWWEDDKYPGIKRPVHELDILKNKGGSEKKVIFYNYEPMKCWDYEVSEEYQDIYRQMVFKKVKQKE